MMYKLWLVAKHEYKREVLTRSFIVAILASPLLIALIIGIGMWTEAMQHDGRPIGYVDLSGWLADPVAPPEANRTQFVSLQREPVDVIAYTSEELAHAALESGDIQAYYILAPDYLDTGRAELVYMKPPGSNANTRFSDFLKTNLLADQPQDVSRRVIDGTYITVRTPSGNRQASQRAAIGAVVPILICMVFMILLSISSTSLVQTVVKEKVNRTMEVMLTSISPGQLIGGKVLGIVGVSMTLLLSWLAGLAFLVLVGARLLGVEWIRHIHLAPQMLLAIIAMVIPTYTLFAGLMTAAGAAMTDAQESQQVGGLLAFSFAIPFWAIQALVEHPRGPLSIGLSLFPLTSLSSMCVLLSFSDVPAWQVAASLIVLIASAVGAVWLASRALRLGMLRYGKRLSWREIVGRTQPAMLTERGGQ
jgi:ABC-2 type transport system permease protein